jgi:hypothetical protein
MMASKYLTREAVLTANDIQREEVDVPEWGGSVLVQALMGDERDALEASMIKGKGKKAQVNLENLRAKVVARCVVDEDGVHIFSDADIPALGKKSAAALNRVYEVAQRLSGITDDDVEELTKNSETAPSEDSGSS